MLITTNSELRLHLPSNAVDDISILSGILDNSEKDFLRDKLGTSLYEALCTYYAGIDKDSFCDSIQDGSYASVPMAALLVNAQRMIANDAMARFAYQQAISINGAGVNVSSSSDYDNASDKMLDKGVQGYKKEALVSLNNLLTFLEDLARTTTNSDASASEEEEVATQSEDPVESGSAADTEDTDVEGDSATDDDDDDTTTYTAADIITLWKQSKYYYYQDGLLIPTADILNQYLDIYDNRDKFIRMLPDLRFIQKNYIRDAFGRDFITKMLAATSADDLDLLDDVRTLIALYLQERTSVIAFDKTQRLQAHNDAIALKDSIIESIKAAETASSSSGSSGSSSSTTASDASASEPTGFRNNRKGNKMFVAPLLY